MSVFNENDKILREEQIWNRVFKDETIKVSQGLLAGVSFDAVSVARPNPTTEVFSLYEGGLAGTLKATFTFVYTNSSKIDLVSVVRS